jgi:predicted nucleic acid-binding protein
VALLTDTNVFLRLLQPHHPHCRVAERALEFLRARDEVMTVASQNLVELWAAATRPATENGLGLTVEEAERELAHIRRLWVLLPELPLLDEWERVVKVYRVSGKNTHDARLVAAMHVHGIDKILTFNSKDFGRYENIVVLNPMNMEYSEVHIRSPHGSMMPRKYIFFCMLVFPVSFRPGRHM